MSMTPEDHVVNDSPDVVTGPGQGEAITDRENRELFILAEREDITITRMRYGPGEKGPDPHVHLEHADAFYVFDGELTFVLGSEAERIRATAGTFVAAPANLVHSFANEGTQDARFLNLHTPDKGFADYLRGQRNGRDVPFDSFDPPTDGGRPVAEAIVSGPGEGERLVSGNRVVFLKGVLPDMCFAEWAIEGRYKGPPLHDHDAQVDSFYVIEGELEMTVEDSLQVAGPDTLASIPRGVRHTFNHTRDGTARVLNVHAPDAGFADFLRRVSD
jgi:mannose-6-phosphate isomerase-like protein (cupin superfamily)